MRLHTIFSIVVIACSGQNAATAQPAPAVEIKLVAGTPETAYRGRLFLFLSQRETGEPRTGPDWFRPEPFFAVDVTDFRPGEMRRMDDRAAAFPAALSQLPAGHYRAQAVLDHDLDHHDPGSAPGNFYSEITQVDIQSAPPWQIQLDLSQVVAEKPFPESEFVRELVVDSPLLTQFHGRPIRQRAAVVLPANYHASPERRYPVIYQVLGFGGSHRSALRYANAPPGQREGETDFIRVVLSSECKWGHHVFTDSATNGPRGRALVEEFIPQLDQQFRTVAAPTGRFVTGHSSGGWSSLWLQVTHPDTFGGVWSLSPDPVDFRDFQQIDLYATPPSNMFVDAAGQRRPIARSGTEPILWFDSFSKMDDVLGRGGQLRSFEAVFSPLDEQGLPRRLWDRATGQIDPTIAAAWQPFDIRLKLEREWRELGPKLAGKLSITTGDFDTFYLTGAVAKLAASLQQLGSDARVTILPGRGHSDYLTPEFMASARREMTAIYRAHHAEVAAPVGANTNQ